MTTKIDISSLDDATKAKIEQYHKRVSELDDVVIKPVTLDYKVGVIEIKEETKEIIRFSEEVAAKLGVDKDDLWDQYFLP
jgi:hypothetical protein